MLLKDKLSLVTGAARGLGEAIAHRMAAEGAHVLVVDRDLDVAQKVAASIREAGGRADAESVDVSDAAAVDALAVRVAASHGDIDVLVNNAGISARSKFDEPGAKLDPVMPGLLNRRSPRLVPALRVISSFGTTVTVANWSLTIGSEPSSCGDGAGAGAGVVLACRAGAASRAGLAGLRCTIGLGAVTLICGNVTVPWFWS